MNNRINTIEKGVLFLIAIMLLVGYILLFTNQPLFDWYVYEDKIVEWVTVIGLLLAAFTCFNRAVRLRTYKPALFVVTAAVMGLVLFFGAGEEISWGQRILGLQSPDYFKQNNSQGETNLHNLVLGGVRINRWVFSFLLTAVLGTYVVLMPFLYRTKTWAKNFIDGLGVPLPKIYQAVAFILLFIICQLMPHGKRAELLEAGTGLLLFLIIRYPQNSQTFTETAKP